MKKSQVFYKAQLSVLNDRNITFAETLEILAVLMEEEKLAKFSEKQKEEQGNA